MGVAPVRLTDRTERGIYIFFEPNNWRRERREIILDYDQLDQRQVDRPTGAQINGSGAVANQQSLQSVSLGRESSVNSGA
jgi:CCR4-NOT transcription complex subunit 2